MRIIQECHVRTLRLERELGERALPAQSTRGIRAQCPAGAGSLIFAVAPECRRLTGLDPEKPAVIEANTEFVAQLLVPYSKPARVIPCEGDGQPQTDAKSSIMPPGSAENRMQRMGVPIGDSDSRVSVMATRGGEREPTRDKRGFEPDPEWNDRFGLLAGSLRESAYAQLVS